MGGKIVCPSPQRPTNFPCAEVGSSLFTIGVGWGVLRRGGGGGWVGLGLGLRRRQRSHGLCVLTSPEQLGLCLRLSGLTASQTADDSLTPPRRWWEGETAVPVCVGGVRPGGAPGLTSGRRLAWLLLAGAVACALRVVRCPVGGVCVSGALGPSGGAGEPYIEATGGSLWIR